MFKLIFSMRVDGKWTETTIKSKDLTYLIGKGNTFKGKGAKCIRLYDDEMDPEVKKKTISVFKRVSPPSHPRLRGLYPKPLSKGKERYNEAITSYR